MRTPSDFGTMGDPPTHPELLDWLADWFVADGWSLKKLHRLILASNTYRMSKRGDPGYAAEDPEDRLLWRAPYRRLDVEAIRDSMLAVAGNLNRPCSARASIRSSPGRRSRGTATRTRSGSRSTSGPPRGARSTPS